MRNDTARMKSEREERRGERAAARMESPRRLNGKSEQAGILPDFHRHVHGANMFIRRVEIIIVLRDF